MTILPKNRTVSDPTDTHTNTLKDTIYKARNIVMPSAQNVAENDSVARLVLNNVEIECSEYPEIRDVMLCGSYTKDTWMPGTSDIDVFIKFDKNTPREKFTEITHNVGFAALKQYNPYVRYSEHPFVEATVSNKKINVVPCFDVENGQWQSSADRTPYHTYFMRSNLTRQMRNDIRLLKQFLQANDLYGAEIARQGFSGYITESLVAHLGSFEGVIRRFANVNGSMVIGEANRAFDCSIVVMDPIDKQRNLTAAISTENMGRFVLLCRKFLKEPSLSCFKTPPPKSTPKVPESCIVVTFQYEQRSRDMIWGQVKSASSAVAGQLECGGFGVAKYGAFADDNGHGALLFLLEGIQIPEYRVRNGPSYFRPETEAFISKNLEGSDMLWIGTDGRVRSFERRSENNAIRFLKTLFTADLERSGMPAAIRTDIRNGFDLSNGGYIHPKPAMQALHRFLSTSL